MESEKMKEIKKALEHCGDKITCQGCPEYNNEPVIDWFECKKNLLQKTITLINELESENKQILEENESLNGSWKNALKRIAGLESENERLLGVAKEKIHDIGEMGYSNAIEIKALKDRIALLEKDNELLRNAKVVYENVDYCYEDLKKAEKRIVKLEKENATKTDTIVDLLKNQEFYEKEKLKQFAEMLKKKAIRRQEFIGELAIDDIEYVKTKDIDETLKEFINGKERK